MNLTFLHNPVGNHLMYVFFYEFRCFLSSFSYYSYFYDMYSIYEVHNWHLRPPKIT
jgi:hypothetical protein